MTGIVHALGVANCGKSGGFAKLAITRFGLRPILLRLSGVAEGIVNRTQAVRHTCLIFAVAPARTEPPCFYVAIEGRLKASRHVMYVAQGNEGDRFGNRIVERPSDSQRLIQTFNSLFILGYSLVESTHVGERACLARAIARLTANGQ